MKQMIRYETNSSTTTGSSMENYRFKSKYIKLVDDINKFSVSENTTNRDKRLPYSHNTVESTVIPTSDSKLKNYKMKVFVKDDLNNINSKSEKPRSISRKRTKEANTTKINFDKMKINPELKDKYKNILDYGLKNFRPFEQGNKNIK
jgi:hypothetical protein